MAFIKEVFSVDEAVQCLGQIDGSCRVATVATNASYDSADIVRIAHACEFAMNGDYDEDRIAHTMQLGEFPSYVQGKWQAWVNIGLDAQRREHYIPLVMLLDYRHHRITLFNTVAQAFASQLCQMRTQVFVLTNRDPCDKDNEPLLTI